MRRGAGRRRPRAEPPGAGQAETQLALATAIGHDKTRLIGVLDALEAEGLITRAPDPPARLVSMTDDGRARHAAAVADIRAMEERFLAELSAAEREALPAILPRLAA
jgi:DNA-binding MarR family transcriptional regulator